MPGGNKNPPASEAKPLFRAEAGEDDGQCADKDFEVKPEGPVVDVLEVELHPLVEVDAIAAADLPDACEPGLHRETATMPRVVMLNFARNRRTRSDETHVAFQDIPELRQFVDAGAAQE